MFNVFLQIVGVQIGYIWTKPQMQSWFKREISKRKKTYDVRGPVVAPVETISRSPWQTTPSRGSLTLHF